MYRKFYIICLILASASAAQAQSALRLGPMAEGILGEDEGWTHFGASLSVETALSRHFTFCGTVLAGASSSDSYGYKKRLLELRPECRYYVREAMNGMFVGVYAMIAPEFWKNAILKDARYETEGTYLGPGVSLGSVMKMTQNLDFTFQVNAAAHLGEPFFPVGGALQLGYRF